MRNTTLSLTIATITASLLHAMPAQALSNPLSNRTFVSGQGTDTGGCALTAPCRSFAYAITVTTKDAKARNRGKSGRRLQQSRASVILGQVIMSSIT
jgi:hypothetical protein